MHCCKYAQVALLKVDILFIEAEQVIKRQAACPFDKNYHQDGHP